MWEEVLVLGSQGPGGGFACWGWSEGRDSSRELLPMQMLALDSPGPEGLKGLRRIAEALSAVRLRRPTACSKNWELGSTSSGQEGLHNEHFYFIVKKFLSRESRKGAQAYTLVVPGSCWDLPSWRLWQETPFCGANPEDVRGKRRGRGGKWLLHLGSQSSGLCYLYSPN